MFNSIEFPTNEITVPAQPTKKNDRSFHMDRGKIVCNGCGGHFPNLVLFENHTHKGGSLEVNMPSKKSGPKTSHRTFNNISEEEMMEAFHKMPELEGCYYKNGSYVCCMCGKGFANPYVLFSHRIIHPPDMRPVIPKPPPGIRTKTTKVKYFRTKTERHKVVVPTVYENTSSDEESDSSDDSKDQSSSLGLPSVTKAVLKSEDNVDEALPITFGASQEMVQVPWVPVDELIKRNPVQGQGSRTYIYKMHGKRSERSTYVNIRKPEVDYKNIVVVTPNQDKTTAEKETKKYTTNPGTEKGLVFTDLDEDKMRKVFNTLPGLQKCKVLKDGKFQCDRCFRVCENPYLLFSHRLTHKDVLDEQVSSTTSEECHGNERKLVFYSLPGLNKCKMIDGQYCCDNCPEKFGNPYLLFTHKMSHDNVDDMEQREPKVIEIQENSAFGNIFGSNGLSHCKVEKGKYFCDKCTRSFTNPYLLLNHKLLHENVETTSSSVQTEDSDDDAEMPAQDAEDGDEICYECNLCQVQFENVDGLASHIEAHTKDAKADDMEATADVMESEQQAGPSGIGRKRDSTNLASSSTDDISATPEVKIIKKEPGRIYPGEKTAVQSESPRITEQIKVKVELVQPRSDNSVSRVKMDNGMVKREVKMENSLLKVKMPPRRPLKRAVVRLERLNIKPNQFCILR